MKPEVTLKTGDGGVTRILSLLITEISIIIIIINN